MEWFQEGSLISTDFSSSSIVTVTVIMLIVLAMMLVSRVKNIHFLHLFGEFFQWATKKMGRIIGKKEKQYHRDLTIGKLNEKTRTVKTYRFLNDLTIDLGIKEKGTTPYELLFMILFGSAIVTIVMCQALFGSVGMAIPMYPIVGAGITCLLYTKANIAHDARIEAVIEAENIICNNIDEGVVKAVRNSIDLMPKQVKSSFIDFLDNVEHKGVYIKTALQELNMDLGSVADDFIKKCIVFELEEEHGIVGMFKDIVEINNIKMEMRIEMKRKFEEVINQFKIGAAMIFIFLLGVIVIYDFVADFYFKTPFGQLIIAGDILILIGEFVYITYLRAKEI